MYYSDISKLIGRTPMLQLKKLSDKHALATPIYAKAECFNPSSSVKDRAALGMLEDAEKRGALREGGTVIEPTSGNTGIGLAMLAAVKGYKAILVMPESMSVERRKLIAAYGARIVLTKASDGMIGAVAEAKRLLGEIEGSFMPSQFDNAANARAHYNTTAPEIWQDMDGKVDAFVAGVGSGGTLTGVGRFLKEKNPNIKIVALEPLSSPLLTQGKSGPHKIQGIGANFVPPLLDTSICDEVIDVPDAAALETAREIARVEGLSAGISSGAAVWGAMKVAELMPDKNVVTLLPDTGERYLSTELFD